MDIPLRSAFDLEKDFSCMICGRGAMAKKRCPGRVGLYWLQMQGGCIAVQRQLNNQPPTEQLPWLAISTKPWKCSCHHSSSHLHSYQKFLMECSVVAYFTTLSSQKCPFSSIASMILRFLQESIGINRLLLGICLNHNLPYLQSLLSAS